MVVEVRVFWGGLGGRRSASVPGRFGRPPKRISSGEVQEDKRSASVPGEVWTATQARQPPAASASIAASPSGPAARPLSHPSFGRPQPKPSHSPTPPAETLPAPAPGCGQVEHATSPQTAHRKPLQIRTFRRKLSGAASILGGMEMLAMAPVWTQSGSELLATLDALKAASSLLATYELQVIARLEDMGTAQELGARDTTELLAQRYRLNPSEVRKNLAFAAALPKYPVVTAALPDPTDPARPSTLGPEQAKVIVSTLEKAPSSVPVDVLEVAEEQMVEAAKITNPRELTAFGRKVLSRLDTDGLEPAEDEAVAKESLRLRRTDGGVKFSGFLAGDGAELFETQIHKLAKPHKTVDGERDPRSRDKRQADALKTVLEAAAGNPDFPGVPHLTVTIDFDDLKATVGTALGSAMDADGDPGDRDGSGHRADRGEHAHHRTNSRAGSRTGHRTNSSAGNRSRAGAGGVAAGDPVDTAMDNGVDNASGAAGVVDAPRGVGELVFGGNLSASAVRLMACDAAILPIVLGGDSQPLDVGTEQRFVNRYLRRALNKRDKGCVVCKAPPWMCHAHHLIHWADGGPTSLKNLVLLCAAHHRAVHDGQWAITITEGTVGVTRPEWADPPPPTALTTPTARAALAAVAGWLTPAHDADVTSSPLHEQPARLPAASTQPNPELAAKREAFRAHLIASVPDYTDPWATDPTPASIP
ncbi:DUF222 domain-containing protein [Kribbella sp. NPDC020789]